MTGRISLSAFLIEGGQSIIKIWYNLWLAQEIDQYLKEVLAIFFHLNKLLPKAFFVWNDDITVQRKFKLLHRNQINKRIMRNLFSVSNILLSKLPFEWLLILKTQERGASNQQLRTSYRGVKMAQMNELYWRILFQQHTFSFINAISSISRSVTQT